VTPRQYWHDPDVVQSGILRNRRKLIGAIHFWDGFRKRTRPLAGIAQPEGKADATGHIREKAAP
jgi:hypothetical protein